MARDRAEALASFNRRKYRERRSQGLCVRCPVDDLKKAAKGSTMCLTHQRENHRYQQRRYKAMMGALRKERGDE